MLISRPFNNMTSPTKVSKASANSTSIARAAAPVFLLRVCLGFEVTTAVYQLAPGTSADDLLRPAIVLTEYRY